MRKVALLRGINLGSRNRVSMADLREVVAGLGYEDVETLLQSGNVVFSGDGSADAAAARIEKALRSKTGLDIAVIGRSGRELDAVVRRNPLADMAHNPKFHHVVFLSARPSGKLVKEVDADRYLPEVFAVHGRDVFIWWPEGVHRARLTHGFWEKRLGVKATARNWNTVQRLAEMAAA